MRFVLTRMIEEKCVGYLLHPAEQSAVGGETRSLTSPSVNSSII
jgi:hypothetical protein